MDIIEEYVAFIEEAERLKSVLRTAWTGRGERESTAEHSWRLALLAGVAADRFPELDLSKLLMMCLIHDIGEIYEGDVSAALRPDKDDKYEREYRAARTVFSILPPPQSEKLLDIWLEYNDGGTPEARLVKALDKAETIIQHNQGINPSDFDYRFNLEYGKEYFEDDDLLKRLRSVIDEKTKRNIIPLKGCGPERKPSNDQEVIIMSENTLEIKLNDGLKLPPVGLGTYQLNGLDGVEMIKSAVGAGYRLLDSAFNYENEGAVGAAVRQCSVPRSELLIASKLPGRHHKYKEALATVEESLYRAGLDYYDLYLIHWPNPKTDLYVEAWQALIEARKRGLIRSIGVCNFLPRHLERLMKETGVTPSINQIELHPYFDQTEQRRWNAEHGIATESWSPLGRGSSVVTENVIAEIAKAHRKSVSQVILRWHVQLGALPIPKASSPQHQRENIDIFDFSLSEEEMRSICGLSRKDGRMFDQDPDVYEEF